MNQGYCENQLLTACRELFGDQVRIGRDFLSYLQAGGVKTAFRHQAKARHPDRFIDSCPEEQKRRTESFRELLEAYDLVRGFLRKRDQRSSKSGSYHSQQPAPSPQQRPAARPTSRKAHYYKGPLPQRPLEAGIYLYYRGVIPYQALIEALVWQRGQRPRIGDIAKRWGWLNEEGIRAIFSGEAASGRFGEKALRLGLLTHFQLRTLLAFQRCRQKKIGQFFIEKGYLSSQKLEALVADLHNHNSRLAKHGV